MTQAAPLPDVLARIVAATRARLAREPAPADLWRRAEAAARRGMGRRSLLAGLAPPGARVIAECKRRSPSAGWLRQSFDPIALARAYAAGGAAAVSVVTEPEFFAGEVGWVSAVRRAVALPVLQKDFLLSPPQLAEAAVAGADAVLLIARVLAGGLLAEMVAAAAALELETLVEIHDAADLARVVELPAPIVGINARDLATFRVDLAGAAALAARVPSDRVVVLESGIGNAAEVRPLVARGLRRFLVGEHLLRAADPAAALAELVSVR
jgi:indole-3-glycerol phosphate synthase